MRRRSHRTARPRVVRGRVAGWVWLLAWGLVLWIIHDPWRELGGIVHERVRWLERLVLGLSFVGGGTAGDLGRLAARPGAGRSHATLLRWLWTLPSVLALALVVAARLRGREDLVGVAFNGWLAWWAGLDITFAALPLARGRSYSFHGAIEPDPEPDASASDPPGPWV